MATGVCLTPNLDVSFPASGSVTTGTKSASGGENLNRKVVRTTTEAKKESSPEELD